MTTKRPKRPAPVIDVGPDSEVGKRLEELTHQVRRLADQHTEERRARRIFPLLFAQAELAPNSSATYNTSSLSPDPMGNLPPYIVHRLLITPSSPELMIDSFKAGGQEQLMMDSHGRGGLPALLFEAHDFQQELMSQGVPFFVVGPDDPLELTLRNAGSSTLQLRVGVMASVMTGDTRAEHYRKRWKQAQAELEHTRLAIEGQLQREMLAEACAHCGLPPSDHPTFSCSEYQPTKQQRCVTCDHVAADHFHRVDYCRRPQCKCTAYVREEDSGLHA